MWHPNVYTDGRLCISILHAPGDDIMSGESAGERWSPAQRVESVLISILSLLDDPEISSPANVDASVMFRDHRDQFQQRIKDDVEKSREGIPEGFVMPTHESTKPVMMEKIDDDFWVNSDAEDDDFWEGGSESDEELNSKSDGDDEGEDTEDQRSEHDEDEKMSDS